MSLLLLVVVLPMLLLPMLVLVLLLLMLLLVVVVLPMLVLLPMLLRLLLPSLACLGAGSACFLDWTAPDGGVDRSLGSGIGDRIRSDLVWVVPCGE